MADNNSSNASKVFLFAAIVLGVLAMVMAFAYIQTAANVDRVPKMKLVEAKHDLRVTDYLNPDNDLKTIEIPQPTNSADKDRLLKQLLDANLLQSYKGKHINRPIFADGLIQLADLGGEDSVVELTPGDRLVSVSVRGSNGLSGLIIPGDYVNLLVTRPKSGATAANDDGSKWETVPILPMDQAPLRVVAVNNLLYKPRTPVTATDQAASAGNAEAPQAITIEATPDQCLRITAMSGAGQEKVTVILAEPADSVHKPDKSATTRSH